MAGLDGAGGFDPATFVANQMLKRLFDGDGLFSGKNREKLTQEQLDAVLAKAQGGWDQYQLTADQTNAELLTQFPYFTPPQRPTGVTQPGHNGIVFSYQSGGPQTLPDSSWDQPTKKAPDYGTPEFDGWLNGVINFGKSVSDNLGHIFKTDSLPDTEAPKAKPVEPAPKPSSPILDAVSGKVDKPVTPVDTRTNEILTDVKQAQDVSTLPVITDKQPITPGPIDLSPVDTKAADLLQGVQAPDVSQLPVITDKAPITTDLTPSPAVDVRAGEILQDAKTPATPPADVSTLPVITDKQPVTWNPVTGSRGERWLPDGSLILNNGDRMATNGQVFDKATGAQKGQNPREINDSIEAAGGRPPPGTDLAKVLGSINPSSGSGSGGGSSTISGGQSAGEPTTGNDMGWLSDTWDAFTKNSQDFLSNPANLIAGGTAIYNISNQKDAAEEMKKAMDNATASQKAMYDQTRADLSPYRMSPAGAEAAAGFSGATGLPNVPLASGGTPLDTSRLTDPSGAIYGGPGNLPNPDLAAPGSLTEGLPDYANFQDPAYEWLRKEGRRQLENTNAARGRLSSGTTMAGLNEQGIGLAAGQMDKVAQMRNQMFGERLGEQQQGFGQAMDLRNQLFGEGTAASQLKFGQLSDRERAQMGQQLAQFEQQNMQSQQQYAQALQLRQMLFGEQLSADELDFMQKYNLAQMGANASAATGSAAMQNGSNMGQMAIAGGVRNSIDSASQSAILSDFAKSLFSGSGNSSAATTVKPSSNQYDYFKNLPIFQGMN